MRKKTEKEKEIKTYYIQMEQECNSVVGMKINEKKNKENDAK